MENNKEKILRDLEYLSGGITTLKTMTDKESKAQAKYYDLFDDWLDTIYTVIDMIEEDYS